MITIRLMSPKSHEKKLTARTPRKLRQRFGVWMAEQADFFSRNCLPGTIEDVMASILLEFLDWSEKQQHAMLLRRMRELAEMYDGERAEEQAAAEAKPLSDVDAPLGESSFKPNRKGDSRDKSKVRKPKHSP